MGDESGQVLTYAQQSRERANYEQAALADRMQEYRQEVERESQRSIDYDTSSAGDGVQGVGRSSHKMIEAVMQSTPKGQVHFMLLQHYDQVTNAAASGIRVLLTVVGEYIESILGRFCRFKFLSRDIS